MAKQLTVEELRQMIRQQLSKMIQINEITQTGAGQAYQTPNAFGKKASADILNR